MFRAIAEQGRVIRLPEEIALTLQRINRACTKLQQELGYEPGAEIIAAELGLSVEMVRELKEFSLAPLSLDAPIKMTGDTHFTDQSHLDNAADPEDLTENSMLKAQVRLALDTHAPREKQVLLLRYGLDDDRSRTLDEAGLEMGISGERVRQIEARAIIKLRQPKRAAMLRDFLT